MKISLPALLLFIQLVVAADLPEPVIPEASGVNIHFITDHEKDLDMIADAGFKFIRMDFSWHATEAKKGQYDWSAYDGLVKNLKARAIRPLFILDYSNPLYEEPWDFLEQFCASGILKDIDAVSVHPYRAKNKPPETAAADFNKLRDLIAKHAPPGHKLPIISGEWGYSSWSRNVSPETQAAFLV